MYFSGALWLAKRSSSEKLVEHYAIIGPGPLLGARPLWGKAVLELMPEGPLVRPLTRGENWQLEPISDLEGARRRIRELSGSIRKHRYDAVSNNCEHWARYIAYGELRSDQVRGAVISAVLVAGLVLLVKSGMVSA